MKRSVGFTQFEVVVALAVVCLLVLGGIATYKEMRAWQKYAEENGCKVIATERGRYYHVPDGQGGTNLRKEPDRKTYRCEDGTTHVR